MLLQARAPPAATRKPLFLSGLTVKMPTCLCQDTPKSETHKPHSIASWKEGEVHTMGNLLDRKKALSLQTSGPFPFSPWCFHTSLRRDGKVEETSYMENHHYDWKIYLGVGGERRC